MNAFTFLNVALHSLLLSAVGWLAVRWVLRDARHRAWAALLMLIVATFAPLGMNWPHEAGPKMEKNETSTATTWTPDWKVNVTTQQTSSSAELKRPADVSSSLNQTSRLKDLASRLCFLAAIGSALALLWHVRQTFRGIALLRSLKLLTPEQEAQIPWREKSYQLRWLPTKSSPCVIGFLKPVIAIPTEAFRKFNQCQWEWMLRHEGEHLHGKDPLIAWLLDTVHALFWWNPFVHLLINHWAQAREEICDAAAIRAEKDAPAYAAFLVEIASTSTAQFSMAASKPAKRLKARIQAMLKAKRVRHSVSLTFATVSILGTSLSVLLISGTGFTNAQETPPNVVVAEPKKDANVPETSAKSLLKPTQIYITSRWVEVDETLADNEVLAVLKSLSTETVFSGVEYGNLQRKLSQRKGVDHMSGPSVTTIVEQPASIEFIREIQTEQTPSSDFIGVRSNYDSSLEGTKIKLIIKADMGYLEGRSFREIHYAFIEKKYKNGSHQRIDDKEYNVQTKGRNVAHLRKETTTTLEDGQTLFLPMGKTSPTRRVFFFVTAKVVEAPPPLTAAQLNAPISMVIQAVDIRHDKNDEDGPGPFYLESLPNLRLKPMQQISAEPDSPQFNVLSNAFTLAGVFTKEQESQLLDQLKARSNVTFYDRMETSTSSAKSVFYKPNSIDKKTLCEVTPVRGSEGLTFDLEIDATHPSGKRIITAVSVWNQQTVILSSLIKNDDQEKVSRLIFITVKN